MATKPLPANDQNDAIAWGVRPVEEISGNPIVIPVKIEPIYPNPTGYKEDFEILNEIRFVAGLMTVIFVLANTFDHLGITGGEPRHTYIAFGCVLSAIVYVSCLIIGTLRSIRFLKD